MWRKKVCVLLEEMILFLVEICKNFWIVHSYIEEENIPPLTEFSATQELWGILSSIAQYEIMIERILKS